MCTTLENDMRNIILIAKTLILTFWIVSNNSSIYEDKQNNRIIFWQIRCFRLNVEDIGLDTIFSVDLYFIINALRRITTAEEGPHWTAEGCSEDASTGDSLPLHHSSAGLQILRRNQQILPKGGLRYPPNFGLRNLLWLLEKQQSRRIGFSGVSFGRRYLRRVQQERHQRRRPHRWR